MLFRKIIIFLLSVLFAFVLLYIFHSAFLYVHESGHIIFGSIGGFIQVGYVPSFKISNWIECIPSINVMCPQQTIILEKEANTLGYRIGGPLLVIILSYVIGLLLACKTKDNRYFAIPVIFFFYELVENFLCGTDNPSNKPYEICNNIPRSEFIYVLIILSFVFIVWFIFRKLGTCKYLDFMKTW